MVSPQSRVTGGVGLQEGRSWAHSFIWQEFTHGKKVVLRVGQLFSLSQSPSWPMLWTSRGPAWHDRPFAPTNTHLCTPENSYQAGQNVGGDEHVEDIVPARGGNQPGQQRPQGRTCAEHSVREGPPTRGPNLPAHPRAAFREVCPRQGSGLSCQGPKAGVADLWTLCRR